MSGMGAHQRTQGATDTWLTPPGIIHALGPFDLDPCAAPSPRPWPTATRHIELPEDGLTSPWRGRVWLNPPYGTQTGLWLQRLSTHGTGTALVFARTETDHWHRWVWPHAIAVLFVRGRIDFYRQDGSRLGNAGAPSALIAYGPEDAARLAGSGIAGAIVYPQQAAAC